ncbi:hypothetical protein GIB67_009791 [Kingdonia uniflora]|uniref:CCHC-type domain-containing protein n=1 Tax=Kingdonia uniflora TaxID=39325 RepID=A0A7J7LXP2_9MAGN|nr:hypothetical protein GIB67_009791 [Kingdonia uniflora]
MGRSKFSNAIRFDVEMFDGKINFRLWQIQVQDILTQGGLRKALKGKPIPKTPADGIVAQKAIDGEEEDWENLDSRAERHHTLKINKRTSVCDHLGFLNEIVSELESIGVKVEDEVKALQLIWSLPSSFKHLQPTLMYGKETLSFEEVTITSNDGNEALIVVAANGSRHNSGWVFDSGATTHACAQKAWFNNYARCEGSKLVLTSDGSRRPISRVGDIRVRMFNGRIVVLHVVQHVLMAQKAIDSEDEDWEDLDSWAVSRVRLCFAKNVLANVAGGKTGKGLWKKLESLYQTKSLSNRLYLKERHHTLKMNEGTSVCDHLGSLNEIVSELESIGVKVEDEAKALQLIWFVPTSFKHLQPSLIYGKETLSFEEVTSTLLSEERRLKGSKSFGENSAMVVSGKKSFNRFRKGTCWSCGQSGHYRLDCKVGKGNGASSARGSESDINKLATVTSNDGDEELLVVAANGSRHYRGWVFDSGTTTHGLFFEFLLIVLCFRVRFAPSVSQQLVSERVQDILTQGGLRKALKGKPIPITLIDGIVSQMVIDNEEVDWEDLDSRAVSGEKTAKGLWETLESLYQTKSLSNRLYLKERLHTLKMNEGMSVGDHLGSLNGIVSELESIGVKVEDEDKALQLIWSLPSSFKHL